MDSEESRPGSSASTSSSSSSNSNQSASSSVGRRKSRSKSKSSSASSRDGGAGGDAVSSAPQSPMNGRDRNADGNTAHDDDHHHEDQRRSRSRSAASDDNQSVRSLSGGAHRSRSASPRDDDSAAGQLRSVSRNQSISPARKAGSKSSRASSVSSVTSGEDDDVERLKTDEISDGDMDSDREEAANDGGKNNGGGEKGAKSDLNISHEDLSDVSDLDSPGSPAGQNDDGAAVARKAKDDDGEDKNTGAVQTNADDDDDELNLSPSPQKPNVTDLRQKLDERKSHKSTSSDPESAPSSQPNATDAAAAGSNVPDKLNDEDALDFEAEEGECNDPVAEKPPPTVATTDEGGDAASKKTKDDAKKGGSDAGELEDGEELEEGEVSDEDEKRPEENEPKPVCRFYTRGQCTWGMSCRFLHPGVTDKGNYTMFDMIRPVPHSIPYDAGRRGDRIDPLLDRLPSGYHHDFRSERPPMHHPHALPPVIHHPAFATAAHVRLPPAVASDAPAAESAWERGLRTAKEMMRRANKRKEQDMDFEDKKMNLSTVQDELEKDNYYIRDRGSPPDGVVLPPLGYPPLLGRGGPPQAGVSGHYDRPSPPLQQHGKYHGGAPRPLLGAGPAIPMPYNHPEDDPYGRSARYRELPPHRMPQYEDETGGKRRVRPAREVIVQRAEPAARGDEWNDPWMRSKSPGRGAVVGGSGGGGGGAGGGERGAGDKRSRRDRRSYSTNSSYSSSSSTSRSDSSSNTSRSPSPGAAAPAPSAGRRRQYSGGAPPPPAGGHRSPVAASGSHGQQRRHPKRSPSPVAVKRRQHSPVYVEQLSPPTLLLSVATNVAGASGCAPSTEGKKDYRQHGNVVPHKRPLLASFGGPESKPKFNPFDRKGSEINAIQNAPSKHTAKAALPPSVRRSPPPQMSRKRNGSPLPGDKRRAAVVSPMGKRKRISPGPPQRSSGGGKPIGLSSAAPDKGRPRKRRSSSSGSGSSDSSGSESGSSYSSSSSSSSRGGAAAKSAARRDKVVPERKLAGGPKKVESNKKSDPGKPSSSSVASAAAGAANASATGSSSSSSKKTTRREELLKQLRAVEDAIARKRQKQA